MFRKDLFDIVIFFARKPSFFIDRRPFWKLEAEKEVKCADKLVTDISVGSATLTFGSAQVESFTGWDELDTNNFYSQASRKIIEMVLKSFFFRATGTISTSSLSMPQSGSQALLFTLGITSCRCGTTNIEIRFQVLLHKFKLLFFRTFWLRTSSQKTVIVWLFLRRCWLKGWSAIRQSILMQRIW